MPTAASGDWTSPAGHGGAAWRRRTDGYQVTVAPLLVDQDNAWQKLLLGGFNNIRVAAHWVRHLGLPDTTVADKLPYWR